MNKCQNELKISVENRIICFISCPHSEFMMFSQKVHVTQSS